MSSSEKPLYQTPTNKDGMAAFVYLRTPHGFNVTLRDMDADETVKVIWRFACFNCAIAKAKELAPQSSGEGGGR